MYYKHTQICTCTHEINVLERMNIPNPIHSFQVYSITPFTHKSSISIDCLRCNIWLLSIDVKLKFAGGWQRYTVNSMKN